MKIEPNWPFIGRLLRWLGAWLALLLFALVVAPVAPRRDEFFIILILPALLLLPMLAANFLFCLASSWMAGLRQRWRGIAVGFRERRDGLRQRPGGLKRRG